MNKRLSTVAVIGAGSIGYRHLKNLEELEVERLVAYDPDPNRPAKIQSEHPNWKFCSAISDFSKEQPDAVIVASPSSLHEEHTRAALDLECGVFVEKPLSWRWGAVEDLAREASEKNIVTMVACNMRFHPGPALIQALLNQRAIGELISYRLHFGSCLPNWRPYQDYRHSYSASLEAGGAILDCIHEIDLALWYAGPARLISALHVPAKPIGLETDGLAEILLRHENGAIGSIHLNFIERDYRRSCVCIGSEGTLEWDFHRLEVLQYGRNPNEVTKHALPSDWQLNQMYIDEMRHFLDCVATGQPTQNSLTQNLPCFQLALAARSSASST
jgi:predicted dehydrogenase